ncbi:hypothetical protein [Rhizobiales bacterium]|uniref:hypothetical protein n=1 Tax=Phyllobacterium sp. 22552 TaxID=3453941 RepID=UPI000E0FC980
MQSAVAWRLNIYDFNNQVLFGENQSSRQRIAFSFEKTAKPAQMWVNSGEIAEESSNFAENLQTQRVI